MRISDWSSDVCSSDLVIFDIAENRIVLQALPVVVAGLIIILPDNLCVDIAGCRIGVVDFIVLAHTAVFVIGKIGRAHSELQSLMRISYAVFCLKKKKKHEKENRRTENNKKNNI